MKKIERDKRKRQENSENMVTKSGKKVVLLKVTKNDKEATQKRIKKMEQ